MVFILYILLTRHRNFSLFTYQKEIPFHTIRIDKKSKTTIKYIGQSIMQALGRYSEISRFDRSRYIKILWENILEGHSIFVHAYMY